MTSVTLQRVASEAKANCASRRCRHTVTLRLPTLLIKLGLSCSQTYGQPVAFWWQRRRQIAASSNVANPQQLHAEDDDEDIGLGGGDYKFQESELGPPPDARYMGAMPIKERKAWRAKAETMAKEKRLLNIQIGQLGLTTSFLRACADILQKHSLVRVKLGEGCGLERRSAAALLEKYLDCVCVHQIGFTVTLYRQTGLPRPSNTLRNSEDSDAEANEAAALNAEARARAVAAEEKQIRKKAGQQKPQQRPPEFSVL